MSTVGIVGAGGYVGRALCKSAKAAGHRVVPIRRGDYEQAQGGTYEVLVNAAMPSGRYWAQQHPTLDFFATVRTTADLVHTWHYGTFIQVSSLSARVQPGTVYGRHKAAAEQIAAVAPRHLIVRLGPMYSDDLKKGVLCDLARGSPVYLSAASRYAFCPRDFVADWIVHNAERTGTVEIGARDALGLGELAEQMGGGVAFSGPVDDQIPLLPPGESFPEVRGVLDFLRGWHPDAP